MSGPRSSLAFGENERRLFAAIRSGSYGEVKSAINNLSSVDLLDTEGRTPLGVACELGFEDIVGLLIERGAKKSLKDAKSKLPIDYAASKGHTAIVVGYLETRKEVCSGTEDDNPFTNLVKLGPRHLRWIDYVKKSKYPLHAALGFAMAFKWASDSSDKQSLALYEQAEICVRRACIIVDVIAKMKGIEVFRTVLKTKVAPFGKSALQIAMDFEDGRLGLPFTANEYVQEVVAAEWEGTVGSSDGEPALLNALFSPWIKPFSFVQDPGCFWGTPRGKFYLETFFYVLFLGVFVQVINSKETTFMDPVEICLFVFVLGAIVNEIFQMKDTGFDDYMDSLWNRFDVIIYGLFLVVFTLRVISYFYPPLGEELTYYVYVIYAINSIFVFTRLLRLTMLSPALGPLLTTIGNMMTDMVKFMVIVSLVMIGFGQGFFLLFRTQAKYYVEHEDPPRHHRFQENWFSTQLKMFRALLGDFDFDFVGDSFPILGPILLAIYLIIGAILLLNLLIAVLSQSYNTIQGRSEQEFKFGFAETVLEYSASDSGFEFPAPLNLYQLFLFFLPYGWKKAIGSVSVLLLIFPFTLSAIPLCILFGKLPYLRLVVARFEKEGSLKLMKRETVKAVATADIAAHLETPRGDKTELLGPGGLTVPADDNNTPAGDELLLDDDSAIEISEGTGGDPGVATALKELVGGTQYIKDVLTQLTSMFGSDEEQDGQEFKNLRKLVAVIESKQDVILAGLQNCQAFKKHWKGP
eukprot:CAMPEP_0196654202 /NCGR_PEP_ID=MMETSP1086-20130531/3888_1 /TAXON_ID=77921 /ORGANISM="Cyanoptyche  gloeocystis , Strain SAG4.97" /LENGTH=748 /DNA_ID=CAMNT_0041985819 /DNA_START=39 /DNA_END=2282 /DNA_ORIENTATION=+